MGIFKLKYNRILDKVSHFYEAMCPILDCFSIEESFCKFIHINNKALKPKENSSGTNFATILISENL
jgi:hypothetical protein